MNITTLLPFILIIGVMLLMTRSAKNKQRQAAQMRDQMQPGSGVRTIGGLVALVKEVRDTTVLLEIAPGVHSVFTKNAISAVLPEEEYDRLVNNDVPLSFDEDHADAASAEDGDTGAKVDLGKPDPADPEPAAASDGEEDQPAAGASEAGPDAGVAQQRTESGTPGSRDAGNR